MAKSSVFEREYRLTLAIKFLVGINSNRRFKQMFGQDMTMALSHEVIPLLKKRLTETRREYRRAIAQSLYKKGVIGSAIQRKEIFDVGFRVWFDNARKRRE